MVLLKSNLNNYCTISNFFIELWIPIISICISIVAIVISTYYAARAYHIDKRNVYQSKKETIFDIFNNFLLFLETATKAEDFGIENYNPEDSIIDLHCLDAIGKVHCFSQKNNLLDANNKILRSFIKRMRDLSNDTQIARKIENQDERKLKSTKIGDEIKYLRKDILDKINDPDFFKEN